MTASPSRKFRIFYIFLTGFTLQLLCTGSLHAKTDVYVKNDTQYELKVKDVTRGGDMVSKKAWKRGVGVVAAGERKKVLAVNRTGKFNWMDPTPRFVEPGKTVTFSTFLAIPEIDGSSLLELKLKLLGTGKTSKMWYSIGATSEKHEWINGVHEITGIWQVTDNVEINFVYRAFMEKGKTHIEYQLDR